MNCSISEREEDVDLLDLSLTFPKNLCQCDYVEVFGQM